MENRKASILRTLNMGGGCCPLGYIVIHTNIVEPLPFLESLEEEGYVRRSSEKPLMTTKHVWLCGRLHLEEFWKQKVGAPTGNFEV
jgi:hypothetical protein